MFRVHPCLWHPCEPNEKNETALSAHGFHTSNPAVRTVIHWSDIGKGHFECQLWFPGETPLDFARLSRDTQKSWTCWWAKPLGCTGEAQCSGPMAYHSRWEYPWVKLGGNENMKGVPGMLGCLRIRCWTHDSWSLKTHCQIITSHRPTGQQLSTGEPRIWLNLQNWFGENTSDYQIMHGQNRTGMFIFCVWLSSALHGLKVTDWHAQE